MAWRFSSAMDVSSWLTALIVVMYHIRFLLFVDYANVKNKTIFIKAFYF